MVRVTSENIRLQIEDVRAFEGDHGVRLPADYIDFLLRHNGGRAADAYFEVPGWGDSVIAVFFGIGLSRGSDLARAHERMSERNLGWCLPIASDPGGNYVCLSLRNDDGGTVWFFDHEHDVFEDPAGAMHRLAGSFEEFYLALRAEPDY